MDVEWSSGRSTQFAVLGRRLTGSQSEAKALFGRNEMIDVLSVVAEVDLDPTYLAAELFWRWVAAAAAPLAVSMLVTTTPSAPARAAACAIAKPTPCVDPVTTTTRPFTPTLL